MLSANRLQRWGPALLVLLAVAFNLLVLRAETLPAQNLNDSSVHASMVRWAEYRIRSGHLPFDGWYPYLSMGASRFHHYQSLPHIITGYLSVLLGTDRVFQWSLYLLLSLWPIAVYAGMRLFGWDRWSAACAALVSPLLVSKPGLGYEDGSYTWRGYGTWSQLWGMWMLPLAWGLSWRAVAKKGSFALAALAVGGAIAVHLLTGYLAILTIGVWVLLAPPKILRRLGRAALVALGSLAVASFMLVPLLLDERVMPQSEISRGTIYYDSFGAKQILQWLFTGQLFDRGRVAVITAFVLIGLLVCVVRFLREERARAVVGAGLLSLVLFFGRPTLGPALKLLPGSSDLFLRRFIMGVHLAGIFLAGIAIAFLGRRVVGWFAQRRPGLRPEALVAGLAVILVLVLSPAWWERAGWNAQGGTWIHEQEHADATDGASFVALVNEAERLGPGRIYAGLRGHWGDTYRIGQVPAYTYLLDADADAVGFTRPAWSLSSAVEVRFDDTNPAQYRLFAIRYLILPEGHEPPVQATKVDQRGRHVLWRVGTGGYEQLVDTTLPIVADRTNLGAQTAEFLRSEDLANGLYPTIAFAGAPAAPPTAVGGLSPQGSPGRIGRELDDPIDGVFSATVVANRPSMIVLSASFDDRWQVTLDGSPVDAQMVAPSFVGRTIPAGTHTIEFRYAPVPFYWVLFLLAAIALAGLLFGQRALELRAKAREDLKGVEEVARERIERLSSG